ncbi:hypothetical protein H5V45_08415 [Nocardioides sp. KIGAM211]|uniref:Uncharacterized protein n=1 Tax=Nocardioides luti TaxID=2761101 RepID=A0A7X0VA95_9ACTN|nr:hypothetical protein [Nocardioides luti]MBB6627341.1 hypothetical protein [Nocardioides luti]
MRMHRIITGAVAIALAGSVPFISATSAQAAPAVGHRTSAVAHTAPAPAARQLPRREISENIVKKGARTLVFKGKVKGQPHYSNKIVKIQRKVGKHGAWRTYKKVRSGQLGGFKAKVGAPRNGRWYFRAYTPKTDKFRASHSAGNYYTYTI